MIISITGKSGSGKTYIARMLASRLCAELVSLDEISHNTLEMNDILLKIKNYFGNSVFVKILETKRNIKLSKRGIYKSIKTKQPIYNKYYIYKIKE